MSFNTPVADINSLPNTTEHIVALQQLSALTFIESFASQNSSSDMLMYINNHLSYSSLSHEIANPKSLFFKAEIGGVFVGYLKINLSSSSSDNCNGKGIEIERIYVLNKFQGIKIGRLFFDKAVEIANQHSADYIWLGVWEKNEKAIQFYNNIGFKVFGSHIFKLGTDEQTDLLMKIEL